MTEFEAGPRQPGKILSGSTIVSGFRYVVGGPVSSQIGEALSSANLQHQVEMVIPPSAEGSVLFSPFGAPPLSVGVPGNLWAQPGSVGGTSRPFDPTPLQPSTPSRGLEWVHAQSALDWRIQPRPRLHRLGFTFEFGEGRPTYPTPERLTTRDLEIPEKVKNLFLGSRGRVYVSPEDE